MGEGQKSLRKEYYTMAKLRYYDSLSSVEKMVFDVVADGQADPNDVLKIAEICGLSELHVYIALRLLSIKNLIAFH